VFSNELGALSTQFLLLLLLASGIYLLSSLVTASTFYFHNKNFRNSKRLLSPWWVGTYSASAVLVTVIIVLSLAIPHISNLSLIYEHCHSNSCEAHIPSVIDTSLFKIVAFFIAFVLLVITIYMVRAHQKRLSAYIDTLVALSNSKQENNITNTQLANVSIINVQQSLVLNAGLVRPKILVSKSIVNALTEHDLKLIVAYEYSKAKLFKNLRIKLIDIFCILWPRPIKKALKNQLLEATYLQAYKEIRDLVGQQNCKISHNLRQALPNDISTFVKRINTVQAESKSLVAPRKPYAFFYNKLLALVYFIALLMLTSNLTHVVIERLG